LFFHPNRTTFKNRGLLCMKIAIGLTVGKDLFEY
jgi:hypothetical protein